MGGYVGFVGLGSMGGRMAKNLLTKNIRLTVFDNNKEKLLEFKEKGSNVCSSAAELASKCEKIFTMLPNGEDVLSVYTGKEGIMETLQQNTLCVDCSTIDQATSIQLSELVQTKKAKFLDAPVSGGVLGAEKATLTFMIGGDLNDIKKAEYLFELMGKNIVHCGKVGSGQVTKLCNNMLLASQMIALAEIMNMGEKLGLDPQVLTSVINSSSGRCWASDTYNPVPGVIPCTPASNNFEPGFTCTLMAKDLSLAQNLSTRNKIPIPMGSLAHQFYLYLLNNPNYASKDFSKILINTNEKIPKKGGGRIILRRSVFICLKDFFIDLLIHLKYFLIG
uniref:3-hydroxyisobutyrate dehydrogenase n=1 Tax=Meloidogyne incognita TaxID=6306 RepID=A0A914M879_MELIC